MAALRRELIDEQGYRGRRYSLNDLCVRKLSAKEKADWQRSEAPTMAREERVNQPEGTIRLVPPPPPIPAYQPLDAWQRAFTPRPSGMGPLEEPQPERTTRNSNTEVVEQVDTRPMKAPLEQGASKGRAYQQSESLSEGTDTNAGSNPALGTNIDEVSRMEDEGGSDGQ